MAAGAGSLLGLHADVGATPAAQRAPHDLADQAKGHAVRHVLRDSRRAAPRRAIDLWRRQMVLGPTPEFGLLSSDPPVAPPRPCSRSASA